MMADALTGRPSHRSDELDAITGLRVGCEMRGRYGVAVVPTIVAARADGTVAERLAPHLPR
jgi:hypothetical protein